MNQSRKAIYGGNLSFILIIILCFVQQNYAQNINAKINRDTIQIGDPVLLEISLTGNGSVNRIIWNTDSIPSLSPQSPTPGTENNTADFEILNTGNWRNSNTKRLTLTSEDIQWNMNNGAKRNTISFTIWNEGTYFLPSFEFVFGVGSQSQVLKTKPIPLIVISPLSLDEQAEDTTGLSAIKPIIEEPLKFEDFLPHIGLGVLLIHLIALIYFLLTNRKKEEILPIPVLQIPLFDYTAEKLRLIGDAKLWQQGMAKEYLSNLTFVLREYLENRFDIPALERTTSQILSKLNSVNLSTDQEIKLKEMLQVADLVKFAKAKPQADFLVEALTQIETFVKDTRVENQNIWVEREKYRQLKGDESQAQKIVTENFRVTQNLEELTNPKRLIYAGFWERFAARLLDLIFLAIICFLFISILDLTGLIEGQGVGDFNFVMTIAGIYWVVSWFYFAWMEARKGGSLGKLILDLRVTDLEGGTVSLGKASFRWLGKVVSETLFFIGNFWLYFNKNKRQTLYDSISKTIVIKK